MSAGARHEGPEPLPEPTGPWSAPPAPPPVNQRRRNLRGLLLWVGLIAAGAAAYAALALIFPGQLSRDDHVDALQLIGWLALVSSGLVFARRLKLGEVVRNLSIWAGVAGVCILGYSFRTELAAGFVRVRGELIPSLAVSDAPHVMTVTASDDGGFYVMGQVNGAPVRFAIDTGANGVLLSPADAQRAHIDMASLKFASPSETANGVGYTAAVTLPSLQVGQLKLAGVRAAVDKTPMSTSLLGMAFLRRLDSFEVKGDQLTLKWKG
ncbi:MAG TPA: TIGR02281 family clan AA aspartic protease [Caulobacteraceae bacterium]|jgi:aspartyl protease family protein